MKKIRTLVRKEILDILRDKKTLVMMIVVPVLLYPLLLIGLSLLMTSMMTQEETNTALVVSYPAEYEEVAQALDRLQKEDADVRLFFEAADTEEEMDLNAVDAVLRLEMDEEGVLQAQIEYLSGDTYSSEACELLEELLEEYRLELVEMALTDAGLTMDVLYPVVYETVDQTSLSESFGMSVGGCIGMLLITTILLGALYPSIDAMAGERERGTLETLLTLPVTNFQIIMSKYISVSIFACVTAVISMLSLGGSVLFLYFGLIPGTLSELGEISPGMVLSVVPMLLLTLLVTALLITALCMCFCVFARSFKEANNYITPAMLVIMIVSMVGIFPSVTLDAHTALIPIANVSLMIKDLISGQFDWTLAALTIVVNFGYSVLIVWVLSRMYDSEAVLFSDGFTSFRIFQKRSDIKPGTMPAPGDVAIAVLVLLLLILYVGSAVTVRSVTAGTAVTQLLILAVPLLLTWYMKTNRKTLFLLNAPRFSVVPGAILLYVGAYLTGIALSLVMYALFPGSAQNLEASYAELFAQPLWILMIIMALMPSIGEELLFRGLIFGTVREWGKERSRGSSRESENNERPFGSDLQQSAAGIQDTLENRKEKQHMAAIWPTVAVSALIFAAFHMSLVKLPATFLLGAAFAYVIDAGGSIYLSMALHFLNNAVSVVVSVYPEQAARWVPFLVKESYSVSEVLLMAGVGILCGTAGFYLLQRMPRGHSTTRCQ
ncbi:MAG: ABC transporter permease subunit [Lachnospiraceae bacterium]|nr:ABC transporter permease subunit [Lachnospiraceae bacterium]